MRNAIIYIGLIGSSVYASYLAGNILAKIDGSDSGEITEQIGIQSNSGSSSSSVFDFLIPQSHNYSLGETNHSSNNSVHTPYASPNNGSNGGSRFQLFEEKKSNNYSGGGGGIPTSTTIVKSSGKNKNRYNEEEGSGLGLNGFGGAFNSIDKASSGAIAMSSPSNTQSSNARTGNSTGGFGTDVGEFNTLSPVPDPILIPLDSGSILLIILGVLTGGYFILKNNSSLKISKEA